MVLGKFPLPGRPTYWKTVGQGTTVLATGTGESYLDIFFLVHHFSYVSWEMALYNRNTVSKGR